MTDFQVGKAGEHLVISELLSMGYESFMAGEGLPYDVVFDFNGSLKKVQVKTSRKPYNNENKANNKDGYIYHIKRCGKGANNQYSNDKIDLFAIVALDTKEIGYLFLDEVKSSVSIRPSNKRGTYSGENDKKAMILELRKKGLTYQKIKDELKVDIGYAQRVVTGKENKTVSGLYFDDLNFERIINDL